MNTRLRKKLLMAMFCLLVLPATALADGSVVGSCGSTTMTGAANPIRGPCVLSGGGSALYGAQAISGVNSFLNIHSPVVVLGAAGQVNVLQMTVTSIPDWQAFVPVLTSLTLSGTVDIFQAGASVDILFTGALAGPPVSISLNFTESTVFSVTVFGHQSMFDIDSELAPPRSTLVVTVNGAASFTGSGEFQGAIPEPATLFLLGTGLTGIAVKLRRKLKKPNGAQQSASPARVHNSMNRAQPEYFLDSILSDLDSLILFAGVHPIYFGFHRMLSKRFPFGFYYEVEDDVVYVYAILDLRRDPVWIRKRLPERR